MVFLNPIKLSNTIKFKYISFRKKIRSNSA